MANSDGTFVVYNLRATYHELGEYEFKVVLHPDMFKNSHESEITITDSDGRPLPFTVKKWGRKINCVMTIGQNVSDGVAMVRMTLKNESAEPVNRSFSFWVIKP